MPEKKKTAPQQEKAAPKKERPAVIYLGPEIPGVVSCSMVFNNGFTPQLDKALEEQPAIRRLLVPVTAVAAARKSLRDTDSAISICYRKALEYARKGERKWED